MTKTVHHDHIWELTTGEIEAARKHKEKEWPLYRRHWFRNLAAILTMLAVAGAAIPVAINAGWFVVKKIAVTPDDLQNFATQQETAHSAIKSEISSVESKVMNLDTKIDLLIKLQRKK